MKRYLMNSGGKDSMASCIIDFEKNGYGGSVDGVVMCEVMFSYKHNIPAEHPISYKWKHEVAIPKLKEMGFNVIIVKSKEDYLSLFNKTLSRSKVKERINKKWGFVLASMCYMKNYCKIKPMNEWCKKQGDFEKIVGYAYDETERIKRMLKTPNMKSILYENKIIESQTFDICKKYDLLSPIYEHKSRDGCWFCPNQSIKQMAVFEREYPHYWKLLEEMSKDQQIACQNFRFGKTFAEVNVQIKAINNQITIFDLIK